MKYWLAVVFALASGTAVAQFFPLGLGSSSGGAPIVVYGCGTNLIASGSTGLLSDGAILITKAATC